MTINSADLVVFAGRNLGFRYHKNYEIFSWYLFLTGVILSIVIYAQEDLYSIHFTPCIGSALSVAAIGALACTLIKNRPPETFRRKFYDTKKPFPPDLTKHILEYLFNEPFFEKTRLTFYSLESGDLYLDYNHNNITATAPLSHLIDQMQKGYFRIPVSSQKAYQSIYDYTADAYDNINYLLRFGRLRIGSSSVKSTLRKIIAISAYIKSSSYDNSRRMAHPILYRAISLPKEYFEETHKVGAIIHDRAFWSTSQLCFFSSPAGGGGAIIYTIKKFRSARAVYHLSANPKEGEWLFPPFSQFKILSMRQRDPGRWFIDLEEVPSETIGTE